jgi:hypothetical protein
MADWIIVGARSAQEAWTEHTPSPDGTCFENGAGCVGEICAGTAAANSKKLEAIKTICSDFGVRNSIHVTGNHLKFRHLL